MRTVIPVSVLLILSAVGGCTSTDVVNTAQVYDPVDAVQEYNQRADKVTLSGGNAQAVNTRIHEVDPWPRNVGDRRIAYDARRVGAAVTRYTTTTRPVDQLPNIGQATEAMGQPPPSNQNININGSGTGASAVAVPVGK